MDCAILRGCVRIAFMAIAAVVACAPAPCRAQAPAPPATGSPDVRQVQDELQKLREEFEALRKQYDGRFRALEQRLTQLGAPTTPVPAEPAPAAAQATASAAPATPAPAPEPAPVAATAPPSEPPMPPTPVPAGSSKIFNPDTSVIGNFLGVAGKNEFSTQPPLALSEAEVAFQAVVDPYARADVYLSATPDGLDIEEGYVTFTSLPAHLLLKVGKMRAQLGKVNTLHTHALPTADRPLVTENLVGGDEGLSDSGFSLSHLLQNPYLFVELTGEVYRGDSAVFQSPSRSRLNYVGRVRAYRDLTEASNLDFGGSVAYGPASLAPPDGVASSPATTDKILSAFDATFRYRPLRRAIYQRLNLRTELIWSRQGVWSGGRETAFGFYGLGEYQFARRWYIGGRGDHSGRAGKAGLEDNGGSVFLTFWPSEFTQVRGQYRRTNYAEGVAANEFLFQINFSIGAHGAHAF